MDNNEKGFTFRKSMRGFNKDDVIKYISEENKRFMAEKSLLEGRLSEAEWTISDGNKKAEEMKNSFDIILEKKNIELDLAVTESEHLRTDLEAVKSELQETGEECEKLRTSVNEYQEQLTANTEKIADLEAEKALLAAKASVSDDLKAENEYLREKYKALELEFRTLSEKLREIENMPMQYQSPRESKEDPFQKRTANGIAGKSAVNRAGSEHTNAQKQTPRYTSEDARKVSNKAIGSIKAIHDDVHAYMNNCVGEFDSYSKDVIESIASLVNEIENRCTLLQEKLNMHRQNADKSLDRRYNSYHSDF